jgi:CheY-like chemotaxis protein
VKKVLIVDDTSVVRSFLTRAFKPHESEFGVLTAENGKEALEIITNFKVDLIITDIEMPVMDGFELLAYLNSNCPEIPVFVMTANGSPEIEERINALGSIKYFEKPMNIDILIESILEELHAGAKGKIEGIGLASFLQLIEMEKKTCTLTVQSKGKTGKLYCLKGTVLTAEAGEFKKEKAVYQLLGWDNPAIALENVCIKKEKEINRPLMSVIMEGLKIKDEKIAKSKTQKAPLKPLGK